MPHFLQTIRVFAMVIHSMAAPAAFALGGSNNVFVAVPSGINNGWKTFEIISAGDDLTTVTIGNNFSPTWTAASYYDWDGVGAYRHSPDILRVFVNHEVGFHSTFSRLDLNVPALQAWIAEGIPNNTNSNQISPTAPVVDTISLGWLNVGSGTSPLNNPCSGNVWLADTFGPGLGFADAVYMTGEEVFSLRDGHIWVMDLATRSLYEAVDLGTGSWENATVIDTGRSDTIAILLSEDLASGFEGTAPISLYVGEKDPDSADFLARNGLVGGNIYYWHADSGETNGTRWGIFSQGNGTKIAGSWERSMSGAVLFSKAEDVHTNMDRDSDGYGIEVAFASQSQAVFLIDCSALSYVPGDLTPTGRDTTLQVLFAAGTSADPVNYFSGMDNLVWSPDGKLYVNEDDGEGDIWVIDVPSLLASYAVGDRTPSVSQVSDILDANGVSESSGITDISEALDYTPGSIFLTSSQSSFLSGNQLALCVSPSAELKSDVYSSWALSYASLDTEAKRLPTADPDFDGYDNAIEFALGLSPDTPESGAPVTAKISAGRTQVSFHPARSLDLMEYYVDYTSDLRSGFTNSVLIRATNVAAHGEVQLSLPKTDKFFARVRVVWP